MAQLLAPTNLTASTSKIGYGTTNVHLTWDDPNTGNPDERWVYVDISTGGSNWVTLGNKLPGVNSADIALSTYRLWNFRVAAFSQEHELSPWSNVISAKT